MKQVLQDIANGQTRLIEAPAPGVRAGHLLVATGRSLISAGTERMLVDFGKANLLDKARQQPDKVAQVIQKARTDGIGPTLEAVRAKLGEPVPMGYCNVGTVIEVGAGVSGFTVGDRVLSNGHHAELVCVPENLCAKVPAGVSDEQATFGVLGAIALQGIRLIAPTLGERIVVSGLGLIGLLAVQILRANGCQVLGLDFDSARVELARSMGVDAIDLSGGSDPVAAGLAFSRGAGVDGVLITASTRSNEPMQQAARMSRKRGRVVLVGVVGLQLDRDDFYRKEISFQVSCSYGPGRYDPDYEVGGQDYPIGFVRWTEQRNFEAVLQLMADGALRTDALLTHRFPLAEVATAYEAVSGGGALGVLLEYDGTAAAASATDRGAVPRRTIVMNPSRAARPAQSGPVIGMLGAGNYGTRVLLPAFKAAGARLRTIVSSGGVSSALAAERFGFEQASSDTDAVFADESIDTVVIATRHDSHGVLARRALESGKHVFVEKPLALAHADLDAIEAAWNTGATRLQLMVGFNRRFAPLVETMRARLASTPGPKTFLFTVNAGAIPPDHWTQDPAAGGGRILGEACHFIDLMRDLAGAPIVNASAVALGPNHHETIRDDKASLTLSFADGSHGTIHYFANGHRAFPKERIEVFVDGRILQLDNFRKLRGFGWSGFNGRSLMNQDKGNAACVAATVAAIRAGGAAPIPVAELLEVSRVTVDLAQSLRR